MSVAEAGPVLTMQDALFRSGLSRATIYREIARGKFPRPVPRRGRRKGWRLSEFEKMAPRSCGISRLDPAAGEAFDAHWFGLGTGSTLEALMSGPNLESRYFDTGEAARYLSIGKSTLAKHRCYGTGPIYQKFGRRVLYRAADLDVWAATKRRRSTSDDNGCRVAVTE